MKSICLGKKPLNTTCPLRVISTQKVYLSGQNNSSLDQGGCQQLALLCSMIVYFGLIRTFNDVGTA